MIEKFFKCKLDSATEQINNPIILKIYIFIYNQKNTPMNKALIKSLEGSCHDILIKNLERTNESVYILYDTLSPLATIVSDAYMSAF